MSYAAFLERKAQFAAGSGFAANALPDYLYDFQRALVEWALTQGRAALFADCGLGKTPRQAVRNVEAATTGGIGAQQLESLLVAPL